MKTKNGFINETAVNEFVISREYNCPRMLIYKAFTEPDRISEWWTPKGYRINALLMELAPDGIFHFGMLSPDGHRIWSKFEFIEISTPEKIVFTSSFADEKGNVIRNPFNQNWPIELLNILTLSEHPGLIGRETMRTTVTLRGGPINASDEERNAFSKTIDLMLSGLTETFDQLANYISKL